MYWKLFSIFFKLGIFAFGGGYSMIPLIELEVVKKNTIIEKEKFDNLVYLAGGLPGAIALNASIFIGYLSKGLLGAIICALGSVLPCLIIITTIMVLFSQISSNPIAQQALLGIRPIVVALIAYASYKLAKGAYHTNLYIILTVLSFTVSIIFPKFPLPIIIVSGIIIGITINLLLAKVHLDHDESKNTDKINKNKGEN